MDRITFHVNGDLCSVGSDVDSDTSLNDFVRERLNLRGTKYMCKEGGCGACVLAVTTKDRQKKFAVNSCLVSVTSCQDWEVTTIEGIGSRSRGYHPVQRTLAEYNGTQCGYCSPGFVMSMYSLLESNDYNLTQYEIENSFGSNTCRCTGLRPILDAFKSFAKDAPKPPKPPKLRDIEDLTTCRDRDRCELESDEWCVVEASDVETQVKRIALKDGHVWYRVSEVTQIFQALDAEGYDSYMLVNGNTGRGAVPILVFPRVLIDISSVAELKGHYIDQNLVFGAGITLTNLMELFKNVAREHEEFEYLERLNEHLDLVAHIPVRNIGTVAGNLMVKHRLLTFSSDVFLLFETVGATLTIVDKDSSIEVTPEDFLSLDMTGRVITFVKLPPLSKQCQFVSFKIMPRSQNAHAQVNSGFLYQFDMNNPDSVLSCRIVFGGISRKFVHARETERFLYTKKIFTNEVLQQALNILKGELKVEMIAGEQKPEYRKKCALGLFYKSLLVLIPKQRLKPKYRSGARDFRKTRPVSKGTEVYDTNPVIWPVNEPMPKVDALIQCAGEAKYTNDIPIQAKEVFCAFVTADICTGEVVSIDPSAALKIAGVIAFFSAKDIPGKNSFLSQKLQTQSVPEEVFIERYVKFYDQAIGIIVAETEKLATRAALLVNITYKVDKKKPILTINDAREREPDRISLSIVFPARNRGVDVQRVIKGSDNIFWQYHFTMETISAVSKPNEDGIEIATCSQFLDSCHLGVSEVLAIPQNRINMSIPRCGGAYGVKITRTNHVAAACSLATYLLDRPCRMVLSIQASLRMIGRRFPCTRDFEVGINNSGEIQFLEYHMYQDNGYVVSDSILPVTITGIRNCYNNRRWQYKIFNVTTDTPSNTYARAPGALEAIAMTEYIMEQISYEINRDPVEVRRANLEPTYTEVAEMIQTLLTDAQYEKRKAEVQEYNRLNRWKKKGLRVAFMNWAVSTVLDYHVLLSVYHGDGTVVVEHGGIEIGQGINTKVIQVIAYTLNISMDKVKCKAPDTLTNPNDFATGGSRTTETVCFGAIKCCQIILDRLSTVREVLKDPNWEVLIQEAFTRGINLQASYRVTANDQEPYRSGGVALAEVELDILTGEHEILRVDIIEDVGTSMNPELDMGQVEGAFIMGVGYWTHEELIYDEHTGELLTDRTWYYHVPLSKDIPIDFRVQLRRNSYNPIGTLGAKAVAEPPSCLAICVAFAIREAIVSSRKDSGMPREKWFNIDGPHTLQANVLAADVKLEEFLFY